MIIDPVMELFDLLASKANYREIAELFFRQELCESFREFQIKYEDREIALRGVFGRVSEEEKSLTNREINTFSEHLERLIGMRDSIIEFIEEARSSFTVIDMEARELAMQYLPKEARFELADIVMLPVPYDARVFRGRVFFDPLLARDLGIEGFTKFLSHEYHHSGRTSLKRPVELETSDEEDFIYSCFEMLEIEGIADLVFEVSCLHEIIPAFKRLREIRQDRFDNFQEQLEAASLIASRFLDGKLHGDALKKEMFLALFSKGANHPVGHRMAFEIDRALGRDTLVATVAHTSKFLEAYCEVAATKSYYVVESRLLDFVRDYETTRPEFG